MFGKKSFLENCKKTFNQHNLVEYDGLYPFCYEDNKARKEKYGKGGFVTLEQKKVCDILLEKQIPFILEHKIISACNNDFWCDMLVQGKYHRFCLEVDGKHHKSKQQRKRDLKKQIHLVTEYEITTERIENKIVNDYYRNPKPLNNILKILKTKLYDKSNKHLFMASELGELKCELCRVKSNKL